MLNQTVESFPAGPIWFYKVLGVSTSELIEDIPD